MNTNAKTGLLKVALGWAVVFLVRLIPWRMPNVEGIMATLMPASKRFGAVAGFFYGALSIALYDLLLDEVGSWTLVGALTYGAIGIGSALFFRHRSATRGNFVLFSIVATLVFDAVTGVLVAPLWGQTFTQALLLQVPFTMYHLAGTTVFALLVAPAFYRFVVENQKLEFPRVSLARL